VATFKGPATHQDVEVRIGRDTFINIPIIDASTGKPYTQLADKIVEWRYGADKAHALTTRRSDDPTNPVQVLPDEMRVIVPVLADDTAGKLPSSPSVTYYHEVMLIDTLGKKANVTEGKFILIKAFSE
jgi:hypothetical protein